MVNTDVLFGSSIVVGGLLAFIGLLALGKTIQDILYQKIRRLNGIRKLQSNINLRIHSNRVLLGISFVIISVISLVYPTDMESFLLGRVVIFCVMIIYTVNTILDMKDEATQLNILLKVEEINNITKVRLSLHSINNKLSELFGIVTLDMPETTNIIRLTELQEQIVDELRTIQHDIHEMDSSYLHQGNEYVNSKN